MPVSVNMKVKKKNSEVKKCYVGIKVTVFSVGTACSLVDGIT